ncbi:phage virion morphogenesis protein [Polaromonas sp. UC242_47]|uniref:phage virion morphogenesis protein n=1 Tax=Polaromonas sp. UC242_47 TaxID=3374626 RepID=UPI0037B8FE13
MSGVYSVWGAGSQSTHIKQTLDTTPITRHLRGLERLNNSHFIAVRREIGEYMLGNVQDNFDGQRLFDGTAMPPSKAAQGRTTHWKANNRSKGRVRGNARAAGKTLIDRHHLYDSYVYQLAGSGVEIGSALIYAAIHHFGGETGRLGHRFTMTARPVLGVAPAQERAIGDFMVAAIGRIQ